MKLIGKSIDGRTIVVEANDQKHAAQLKRTYAKIGVSLRSYDAAIRREAARLVNHPDRDPEYKF